MNIWLSSGSEIAQKAKKLIDQSNNADIAIAFWGRGGAGELGLINSRKGVRVICNALSGATNPSELEHLLRKFPNSVRSLDNLHAKVIVGDNELICGSANASANGLGIEGARAASWSEAALSSTDKVVVGASRAWFEAQWSAAVPVDADVIKLAKSEWHRRQKLNKASINAIELSKFVKSRGDKVAGCGIYVQVSRSHLSEAGDRKQKEVAAGRDGVWDIYEDTWEELKGFEGAKAVIHIQIGPRGGIGADGFWMIPTTVEPVPLDPNKLDGDHYIAVRRDKLFMLPECEIIFDNRSREWVKSLAKRRIQQINNGDKCYWELSDFVKQMRGSGRV